MMPVAPEVSFCATNLNTGDRIAASIDSILELGAAIDRPFEVVVADGPSTDGARATLEVRARDDPRIRLVTHAERNRGYGRRRAFEASQGTVIVPFDTSIAYDARYGGLLAAYVHAGGSAMLFSEICALRRATIEAVGGWRDLVGGEDVDLYARVIERFGLVAWPTDWAASQSKAMGSYARQMRYVSGARVARWRRILAVQRDQIVGANYTVADLMAFNAAKPWGRRFVYRLFFTLAATRARTSPLRPYRFPRNNYLILREETLRSMLEGRERALGWSGPAPRLLLTEDEVGYLARRSRLWAEATGRVAGLVGLKGHAPAAR